LGRSEKQEHLADRLGDLRLRDAQDFDFALPLPPLAKNDIVVTFRRMWKEIYRSIFGGKIADACENASKWENG